MISVLNRTLIIISFKVQVLHKSFELSTLRDIYHLVEIQQMQFQKTKSRISFQDHGMGSFRMDLSTPTPTTIGDNIYFISIKCKIFKRLRAGKQKGQTETTLPDQESRRLMLELEKSLCSHCL